MASANRPSKPRHSVSRKRDQAPAGARPRAPGIGWRLAVVIAVASLTYANSVSKPFVFDDHSAVVSNEQIHRLWTPSVLFPERERPVAGRPLVHVSFAINYAMGGLNVRGYHIGNIAVHVVCALLLFAVVRRTLELPAIAARLARRSTDLAFAVSLIWSVHPLNSEVVDYITQRTESMMALFYLLTLYGSLRAVAAVRPLKWELVAVMACALGMGCKESMATAPLVIVLFDRIFVFGSFRKGFESRWRFYTGLAGTWLILAGLLSSGPRSRSAGFSAGVSPWTYVLNQPPLIARYLRLAVWPRSLVLNYGWPKPLVPGDVLPSAVFIASLLATTLAALRRQPGLGFLGVWFFVTLAPTSSIVPIATEVGAERRMYLPLMAVVVLAVVGAVTLWDRVKGSLPARIQRPKAAALAGASMLAVVSAALAAGTIARNREYSSELLLARTIIDRYPTPIAHQLLAVALLAAGDRADAMPHLRQALPGAPRAHLVLGVELFRDGKLEDAIVELQAFIQEQPYLADVAEAHEYLGRAFATEQRWQEAATQFRRVLEITPSDPIPHRLLAEVLFSEQELDEAIAHYRAYLDATQWKDVDVLNQVGIALGSTGKLDEALAAFRRAAEVDPASGAVQRNLANALWAQRNLDEAAVHARQAIALQPDDADSHDTLGRILEQQGRFTDAAAEYERSLQIDPTFSDARSDLARVRQRRAPRP